MRFVLAAAALVAVFTAVAVPAGAHTAAPGPQCGGTLWKLMTLSDTGKTGVSWAGAPTTIADIAKLATPVRVPSARSTRHHATAPPQRAITVPTWRGPHPTTAARSP